MKKTAIDIFGKPHIVDNFDYDYLKECHGEGNVLAGLRTKPNGPIINFDLIDTFGPLPEPAEIRRNLERKSQRTREDVEADLRNQQYLS